MGHVDYILRWKRVVQLKPLVCGDLSQLGSVCLCFYNVHFVLAWYLLSPLYKRAFSRTTPYSTNETEAHSVFCPIPHNRSLQMWVQVSRLSVFFLAAKPSIFFSSPRACFSFEFYLKMFLLPLSRLKTQL